MIWNRERISIWGGSIIPERIRKRTARFPRKGYRTKPCAAIAPSRVTITTAVTTTRVLFQKYRP